MKVKRVIVLTNCNHKFFEIHRAALVRIEKFEKFRCERRRPEFKFFQKCPKVYLVSIVKVQLFKYCVKKIPFGGTNLKHLERLQGVSAVPGDLRIEFPFVNRFMLVYVRN
jgi:hypothetical protein